MNLFIWIVIMLIMAITILISIYSYRDWKENFQDDYREMMLEYEEKKMGKDHGTE